MGSSPTRITVEIDAGDPVRGRLIDATGADQAFYGWLELTRALECARDSTCPTASVPGDPTGAGAAPSGEVP